MYVGELERLHQTQCLINRSSDWQIIDSDLTQILFAIDDEQATEWNARLFVEHTVVTSDLHRLVGQQRNGQMSESTLLAWLVDPGEMREVAVGRAANHHRVDGVEFGRAIRVGDDLGGAYKCAVFGIIKLVNNSSHKTNRI